jgi:hypothetical protein
VTPIHGFLFVCGGSEDRENATTFHYDVCQNAISDFPSNAMFCTIPEIEKMYGPTLTGFVRDLRQDTSICVVGEST